VVKPYTIFLFITTNFLTIY